MVVGLAGCFESVGDRGGGEGGEGGGGDGLMRRFEVREFTEDLLATLAKVAAVAGEEPQMALKMVERMTTSKGKGKKEERPE